MKAMIFAAGLGTRLRPLTDRIPKALVKYRGKTLLEQSVLHLKENGVTSLIVNVHHHARQIIDFLKGHDNFGMEIAISDESDMLLDTGGGLKKASWFFPGDEPFIVRNVDVISDLDLENPLICHVTNRALATLVVRERETSRYLLYGAGNELCGWENRSTGEWIIRRDQQGELSAGAFSGIQVLSPAIFPLISEDGKFPVMELYLRLAADHRIIVFLDKDSSWLDAGKKEVYE
jgi:NDP-sugar pyrophosphorylase family protein